MNARGRDDVQFKRDAKQRTNDKENQTKGFPWQVVNGIDWG